MLFVSLTQRTCSGECIAEIAQLEAQMQLLQAAAAEKEKKALEVKESATAVVKKKGWWPF